MKKIEDKDTKGRDNAESIIKQLRKLKHLGSKKEVMKKLNENQINKMKELIGRIQGKFTPETQTFCMTLRKEVINPIDK